ncbi:MAG: mechanosensitive ion channel [Chitinophagaceae bacterium]|nr:MAG: mechanosensitive ion channel [Chitinophagaceae bacterium]
MVNVTKNTNTSKITLYFVINVLLAAVLLFINWRFPDITQKKWVGNLMKGFWAYLIPSMIVSIIRVVLISVFNARHAKKAIRGNFVLGINRLSVILNVCFFTIAIMFAFGINPIEFLTSMTIVAMAVAVTFREYITNMLSGLFIMFSDQLSVGDRIKLDHTEGRIQDITFSSIVLKNEDEDIVTIPNNMVFTHPLINLSAHRSQYFTVRFELPISIAIYTQELEAELLTLLKNHPDLSPNFKEALQIDEIGKDFVKYKIELMAISNRDKAHQHTENEILKSIIAFKSKKINLNN